MLYDQPPFKCFPGGRLQVRVIMFGAISGFSRKFLSSPETSWSRQKVSELPRNFLVSPEIPFSPNFSTGAIPCFGGAKPHGFQSKQREFARENPKQRSVAQSSPCSLSRNRPPSDDYCPKVGGIYNLKSDRKCTRILRIRERSLPV